jgi:hypothetical protein
VIKDEGRARKQSLDKAFKGIGTQLNELVGLRLRNLLSDDEFVVKRRELQQERLRIQGRITESDAYHNPIEPFLEVVSFSNRAA